MKIQKNSKFYRYLYFINKWGMGRSHPSYIEATIPTTVCSLFWFVIFGTLSMMFKASMMAFLFLLGGSIALFAIAAIVIHPFEPLISFSLYPADPFGAFLAMLGWFLMGTLAIIFYRETNHYHETRSKQFVKAEKKRYNALGRGERTPNQFIQLCKEYAKAAKDRVCPLIEYE